MSPEQPQQHDGDGGYDSLYAIGRRLDRLEAQIDARLLSLERTVSLGLEAELEATRTRRARTRETQWGLALLVLMLIGFAAVLYALIQHAGAV